MTILSHSPSKANQPKKMSQLESLEAKMASIEVSLSASSHVSTPRRRKGTSLGSISIRSSPKPDLSSSTNNISTSSASKEVPSKELRSALVEREAVIQSLRMQLGLAKLPRPTGPAFTESERPGAEQRLSRLLSDAENKKVAIRNLKSALEKLDITDNIDVRIRQAELEYALGREELHLLSIVEECRALQARLDKSKPEANTLFCILESGVNLSLVAVRANSGRWNASYKNDLHGFIVDWSLEGESLVKGDRLLEVNGHILTGKSREELQKLIGGSDKSEIVVLRKKPPTISQIDQYQQDNQRLQHRISYLEEQVNELQNLKEKEHKHLNENQSILANNAHKSSNSHITSISISSPPSTPPDDNKPQVYQRGSYVAIVENKPSPNHSPPQTKSHHITTTLIKDSANKKNNNKTLKQMPRTVSTSALSIHTDAEMKHRRELRRIEREKMNQQYLSQSTNHINGLHRQSVEYLNQHNTQLSEKRRIHIDPPKRTDMRSVRSLDFDSDIGDKSVDYTSEPVAARIRPVPPKKPLRLSLHRAQSLQTVEAVIADLDKKRTLKRPHRTESSHHLNENGHHHNYNGITMNTASLGRQRYV
uniref:CSON007339 protein n=1 Tax=Culicoides sonorensis TaxID=179676 RepID=A0A336LY28_CULSO